MFFTKLGYFCLYFTILLICNEVQSMEDTFVQTDVGDIRGKKSNDGTYSMFLGIPFAKVNKSNPFGVSSPYPTFNEVFEAVVESEACPQVEEFNNTIVGSLDCLNLNVYVPNTVSKESPAAVLVWIYGGSFAYGFSTSHIYGPQFIIRHDVILVTFNYRVGPYGFMCLHTPEVPGNQGFKDQLLALRWVNNNIAAFGGDTNRITVFGESAGAIAVDLHVLSEQEKLYNNVILQSSTSFNPRAMRVPVTTAPINIASQLGYVFEDVNSALKYIATEDPHKIIAAAARTNITFRPCVEKDFVNVEKIVRDYPVNINSKPKAQNMSVLIGFNNDELFPSFAIMPPEAYVYLNDFNDRLDMSFDFDNETLQRAVSMARHFYIGDEDVSEAVMREHANFATDFQYVNSAYRGLRSYLDNGADKVYFYSFSYNGSRNFVKRRLGLNTGGAAHADELGYLFHMDIFPEDPTEEDQLIIDRMTTMWTNFAKYGSRNVEAQGPEIVTNVGTIRGVRAEDGDYSMFLGIPFGKVNETNPFADSIPYPKFSGVFEANDDSVACPQIEEFNNTFTGSLDCLILNVYVPDSASPQNPLPVLFYIYGGGFSVGFHNRFIHGPKFIVRHDVVLVSINYRLGPYGFMCLHTPEVPGNQGLRDQILGLKWVKDNIAAFGGDPNKVTMFGNSAGAMSIDYHVLSASENLFHGIILQSGSSFVGRISGSNEESLLRLAAATGRDTTNVNDALAHVSRLEPATVIQTAIAAGIQFFTCIENDIEGVTKIISGNAVNMKVPKNNGLKVMIGVNDDELLLIPAMLPPEFFPFLAGVFGDQLDSEFVFDEETKEKAEKRVRNFYIGDDDFTSDIMFELGNFFSDIQFVYPTERTVAAYLDSEAEVFYYVFSYSGGRNFNKLNNGLDIGGAYHADEVGYLFDMQIAPETPTPEDQLIIDRMTTLWTNFAKYGDPTPETTDLLPVKWVPIKKGLAYSYLNITTDISVSRKPFRQRMTFWDLFYDSYGQFERTFIAEPLQSSGHSFSSIMLINVLPIILRLLW